MDSQIIESIRKDYAIIANFPYDGIYFNDPTPFLENNPDGFRYVVDEMCRPFIEDKPDYLCGIESMGFVFAGAIAYKLGIKLVQARKKGKIPRKRAQQTFVNTYDRESCFEIPEGVIGVGSKVLIVDDWLARGNTVDAVIKLIEGAGGVCIGVSCLAEGKRGNARAAIEGMGIPVYSVTDGADSKLSRIKTEYEK